MGASAAVSASLRQPSAAQGPAGWPSGAGFFERRRRRGQPPLRGVVTAHPAQDRRERSGGRRYINKRTYLRVACLACHWSRAKWRAAGAPGQVLAGAARVVELGRVVHKVLATVPLVACGIPRRRRAAERRQKGERGPSTFVDSAGHGRVAGDTRGCCGSGDAADGWRSFGVEMPLGRRAAVGWSSRFGAKSARGRRRCAPRCASGEGDQRVVVSCRPGPGVTTPSSTSTGDAPRAAEGLDLAGAPFVRERLADLLRIV